MESEVMNEKAIKKYVQYKVRQLWIDYPVPIPKKTIRNLEINLYQEFKEMTKKDQKDILSSDELVRTLMFKYLDRLYDDN